MNANRHEPVLLATLPRSETPSWSVSCRFGDEIWDPLGCSWVVISRVFGRITIVITHIRGLRTLLITTHEPPSNLGI